MIWSDAAAFDINFDQKIPSKTIEGDLSHEGTKQYYDLNLDVKGQAGDIIDLEGVKVHISNEDGDDDKNTMLSGKNLITFKSDINYDGRVSMKDLAYLNAAATTGYNRDVDVNYDDEISMDDLADMDRQWGKSLHSGSVMAGDSFTGNDQTIISLSSKDIGDNGKIDNTAFIQQNATEQLEEFVGTLAIAGSQGYTDPYDENDNDVGQTADNIGDDQIMA